MFKASDVKELRERTGAGMLDCKKALDACEGDMDKAIDWLREKGISKAAKKEGRIAAEGVCVVKAEGSNAVILEVNSETDFVAQNKEFLDFTNYLADVLLKNDATTVEDALKINDGGETIGDKLINLTAKIGEKLSHYLMYTMHQATGASVGYTQCIVSTGTLMVILPLLVLYLFAQKGFVESLSSTGIKM